MQATESSDIHISSPSRRVLIHCQYVYGIGHYVRAVELARGLSERFEVFLLNGGEPVPDYPIPPGLTSIQLPAIYKEEQADYLSPVDPGLSLEACFRLREARIGATVRELRPDILITEHFPFGLMFENEVLDLIAKVKEANAGAKIVCSVRDVTESGRGGTKDLRACEIINRWYDLLLVHGDAAVVPFAESFSRAGEIRVPMHSTGYVMRALPPPSPAGDLPVLLASVGGGRLGEELLDAVLAAHPPLSKRWNHRLALFTGAFQQEVEDLRRRAETSGGPHVVLHPFEKDGYRRMLAAAAAIVCLGGYNSLIEAVSTRRPVLIYKRRFHGTNREQDLRSTLFERRGLLRVLQPEDLESRRLSGLIADTVLNWTSPSCEVDLNGAAATLQLISQL